MDTYKNDPTITNPTQQTAVESDPSQKISQVLKILDQILYHQPYNILDLKYYNKEEHEQIRRQLQARIDKLITPKLQKAQQIHDIMAKIIRTQKNFKCERDYQDITIIIREMVNDEFFDQVKLRKQIQSNHSIDEHCKINLEKLLNKIDRYSKCQQEFTKYGIKMQHSQVKNFFQYLYNINELLSLILAQFDGEQMNQLISKQQSFLILYPKQQKLDIKMLSGYIQKLMIILKQNINAKSKDIQEEKSSLQTHRKSLYVEHQNSIQGRDRRIIQLEAKIHQKDAEIQQKIHQKDTQIQLLRKKIQQNTNNKGLLQTRQKALVDQRNQIIRKEKQLQQKLKQSQFNMAKTIQVERIAIQQKNELKLKEEIKRLNQQNDKKIEQANKQYQEKLKDLETKMTQKNSQIIKLQQIKTQKQQQVVTAREELLKIKNDFFYLQEKNKALTTTSTQLTSKNEQLQTKNTQIVKQKQQLEKKNGELTKQSQQYKKKLQIQNESTLKLKKQLQQIQQQIIEQKSHIQVLQSSTLFSGKLLGNPTEQALKERLIRNIRDVTGQKITKTELLYQMDIHNPTSPHTYIDNVSNWVILMRISNSEYIVGAFSEDPLVANKKDGYSSVGLMFNLNIDKFYRIVKNSNGKKGIYQYNQFYFIIGNSQIRLNLKSKALQHNFGNNFKNFDTGKDTAQIFFGPNSTKMQVTHYQFYQVHFE